MASKYEKETIINFNEEESTANIYTASASFAKKLAKLGNVRKVGDESWEIDVPKSWVTIKKPKQAVKLTDAQKVARKKQLAEARKKRHFSSET